MGQGAGRYIHGGGTQQRDPSPGAGRIWRNLGTKSFRRHRGATRDSTFFFFNDTATTEIYTLSLHDALPISTPRLGQKWIKRAVLEMGGKDSIRSEEHTSELQSRVDLVCRLLLEKKKKT